MITDHICVFLFIFTINNIVDCPLGIPTQRCGEHLLLLRKVVHADEQVIWYFYLYLERGHDVHADEQYRGHSAGEVICDDFYIIYASDEDLSCGDDEK